MSKPAATSRDGSASSDGRDADPAGGSQNVTRHDELTDRQREVVVLVGLGLTITEAAKVLGLSREAVSRTANKPDVKQAICNTRETAALSRASKLHRLGDEALDLALREVRDAGNVNVALTVLRQMLAAEQRMPSVVIEVPSRETTPPTLADLFDGPVDDETVIDLAEEIHRRAKQAEVEGWPQPTGFLSDPFPELNDDSAPADQ